MVVLETLSAVPVVVVSVLAVPVTATVPPPVALNAARRRCWPARMPPVKLIVAPVFEFRLIPGRRYR